MPLIASLLGLGSTSTAIVLARYRWVFLALAVLSLAKGFHLNVLRRSTRLSRTVFWVASAFTIATLVRWGWWRF